MHIQLVTEYHMLVHIKRFVFRSDNAPTICIHCPLLLLLSADFFLKLTFLKKKILSLSEYQMGCIQIRTNILLVQNCLQRLSTDNKRKVIKGEVVHSGAKVLDSDILHFHNVHGKLKFWACLKSSSLPLSHCHPHSI